MNWGVELLQSSALPLGYGTEWSKAAPKNGASDEARTRYLHLGKVALYQMSYTRMLPGRGCPSRALFGWCLRSESNQRHEDFQSSALPTELQRQIFLFERLQAGKPSKAFFAYFPFQKKVSGDSEGAFASSFGWRIRQLQSGEISGDSEGT